MSTTTAASVFHVLEAVHHIWDKAEPSEKAGDCGPHVISSTNDPPSSSKITFAAYRAIDDRRGTFEEGDRSR